MYHSVVEDSFLPVMRAFFVRLGPLIAIQLRVTFAARTGATSKVGVFLHKSRAAYGTENPGHFGLGEQNRGESVVSRDSAA
jgi:hypothetical protein